MNQPSRSPRWAYSPLTRRYRNLGTGRFVSADWVAAAVDAVAVQAAAEARTIAERLTAGQSDLAAFRAEMTGLIRQAHTAATLAGRGGADMVSGADLTWTGQRIREQLAFLDGFVADVAAGTQPLGGVANRASLYGDAMAATHREMERRAGILAGGTEERSFLGVADHCGGCLAEARRGWVMAGSLVPVGARTCRVRCHCAIRTRTGAADATEAGREAA